MAKPMKLLLVAPHATDDERARGLVAAENFLRRAGISVQEARQGLEAREAWDASGLAPLLEPDPVEVAAAEAWDNASEAAMMACYRGRTVPWGAALRVDCDDKLDA